MSTETCPHIRAMRHEFKDNLVGMVIAVKGSPCTGKTTLARALAKSLRCTLASHDDFLSCTSDTKRLLSTCPSSIETLPADHLNDLSYEVLWQVVETQLRRHHSVVIDSSLPTRAHLDRFLALSASSSDKKNIDVMPIIIECRARDKTEWRRRLLSKTYGPEETERILEEDDGTYDTGDIPKLVIDTTSQLGIEELVRHMENFVLACLDKNLYGEMLIGQFASGCTDCVAAYIEKLTAHLPANLKHRCHEHELALQNVAGRYASGMTFRFTCYGCGGVGRNLHYTCVDLSCGFNFMLHAKCALNLPLMITVPFHKKHPPLVLASRPLDPKKCYCDYCKKKIDPEVWIYSCEECEYQVHVRCANPEFFKSPELVEY